MEDCESSQRRTGTIVFQDPRGCCALRRLGSKHGRKCCGNPGNGRRWWFQHVPRIRQDDAWMFVDRRRLDRLSTSRVCRHRQIGSCFRRAIPSPRSGAGRATCGRPSTRNRYNRWPDLLRSCLRWFSECRTSAEQSCHARNHASLNQRV